MSNYFRLDHLESDPTKLVEWLTDYATQKLIAYTFETHKVFCKDNDGHILVHKNLGLHYKIWFDTDTE